MNVGRLVQQSQDYKTFVPNDFPFPEMLSFSKEITYKHSRAEGLVGKLNGITRLLPDVDFFLLMYIRKDAAASSQIEGTKATMIHAIEAEGGLSDNLPADVDDIMHYIHALSFGLKRIHDLPMSLRFIRELHEELMRDAREDHPSDPGKFRRSQNFIGGTSPSNARFVPPPPHEIPRAMTDLEVFIHAEDMVLPLIKAGLIHAQFETIHPFLDGNGRTGRLLTTIFLWMTGLLERPVLYLSAYFRKHQPLYYERLDGYHNGQVERWLDFMLDGVIRTAEEAILTSEKITVLRQEDMDRVQQLSKVASESTGPVLRKLFRLPIVRVRHICEWTGFTRRGGQKVVDRLIDMNVLEPADEHAKYGRSYVYSRYLKLFTD